MVSGSEFRALVPETLNSKLRLWCDAVKTDVSIGELLLLRDIEVAGTFFAHMRGLMFRRKIVTLLFVFDTEAVHDIHSFFVFGKFDAIYLDERMNVVEVFTAISPFAYLATHKPSKYLLETPAGFAREHGIAPGGRLSLTFLEGI